MIKLCKKILNSFYKPKGIHAGEAISEAGGTICKSVTDLFRMDLDNLPLRDFTEGRVEVNADGYMVQNFIKELDYKECGIFDTVQVKLTGDNLVNIIFRTAEPAMVNADKMAQLISNICDIYDEEERMRTAIAAGPESSGDHRFYFVFGHNWTNYPRYKIPVPVRRYAEDIFISVWGIRHREMAAG